MSIDEFTEHRIEKPAMMMGSVSVYILRHKLLIAEIKRFNAMLTALTTNCYVDADSFSEPLAVEEDTSEAIEELQTVPSHTPPLLLL